MTFGRRSFRMGAVVCLWFFAGAIVVMRATMQYTVLHGTTSKPKMVMGNHDRTAMKQILLEDRNSITEDGTLSDPPSHLTLFLAILGLIGAMAIWVGIIQPADARQFGGMPFSRSHYVRNEMVEGGKVAQMEDKTIAPASGAAEDMLKGVTQFSSSVQSSLSNFQQQAPMQSTFSMMHQQAQSTSQLSMMQQEAKQQTSQLFGGSFFRPLRKGVRDSMKSVANSESQQIKTAGLAVTAAAVATAAATDRHKENAIDARQDFAHSYVGVSPSCLQNQIPLNSSSDQPWSPNRMNKQTEHFRSLAQAEPSFVSISDPSCASVSSVAVPHQGMVDPSLMQLQPQSLAPPSLVAPVTNIPDRMLTGWPSAVVQKSTILEIGRVYESLDHTGAWHPVKVEAMNPDGSYICIPIDGHPVAVWHHVHASNCRPAVMPNFAQPSISPPSSTMMRGSHLRPLALQAQHSLQHQSSSALQPKDEYLDIGRVYEAEDSAGNWTRIKVESRNQDASYTCTPVDGHRDMIWKQVWPWNCRPSQPRMNNASNKAFHALPLQRLDNIELVSGSSLRSAHSRSPRSPLSAPTYDDSRLASLETVTPVRVATATG